MGAARYPSAAARDQAVARLWTAWLWRGAGAHSLDTEDAIVMDVLSAIADGDYQLAMARLEEAIVARDRKKGLEY